MIYLDGQPDLELIHSTIKCAKQWLKALVSAWTMGLVMGGTTLLPFLQLLPTMPLRNTADIKRSLSLRLANSHSAFYYNKSCIRKKVND